MPRKTIVALLAQADATIEDNATGAISAADVRSMVKDIIDTFGPGWGAVGNNSVTLPALGPTAVVVPYAQSIRVTAEFQANLAAGTVKRLAQGLPHTNTRVTFTTEIACPDGNEVVFSLWRDGASVPGGTTASGRGIGNKTEATFVMIDQNPSNADSTYSVRVSKISGAADDVLLTNVRFILEVVPSIGA